MSAEALEPERCRRRGLDHPYPDCGEPAVAVVWGKLADPRHLGPRCAACLYAEQGTSAGDLAARNFAAYWIDERLRTVAREAERLGVVLPSLSFLRWADGVLSS